MSDLKSKKPLKKYTDFYTIGSILTYVVQTSVNLTPEFRRIQYFSISFDMFQTAYF